MTLLNPLSQSLPALPAPPKGELYKRSPRCKKLPLRGSWTRSGLRGFLYKCNLNRTHRKKLQPMEELKLYEGRPADCTGRLEKEIRTYDLLDKLGIQFWRTDHGWMM